MRAKGGASRRAVLLAPLAGAGCAAPFGPLQGGSNADAEALLQASARAHGAAALAGLSEVTVRYAGEWRPIVDRLQPVLVDAGFRAGSVERLRLRDGVVEQDHTGPLGRKRVEREWGRGDPGSVRVLFNGVESTDTDKRDAAALVADGYALFLLGPMLLAGLWAARRAGMAVAGAERITVAGQEHACDVLRVGLAPGLGLSARDELMLFIDRDARLMRRVRFSLDGLAGTQGAVAEVDTYAHVGRDGVQWPAGFYERLLRPAPLPVHDWQLKELGTSADRSAPSVR